MNNKRKASVLFLIAFLSFGMAFAPMAYVGFQNAEPAGLAPSDSETQELMESISRRLDNFMDRKDKLDPTLRTFVVTGELDNDVVTTSAGDISVMLYLDQATPMRSVHDVTNVKWTMDLGMFKIVFASVSGAQNIRKLDAMKDVMYVEADMRVETAPIQPIEAPEAFEFGEVVGADAAKALGYDGSGVTIGIVDGAVDFSIPDLQDALYYDGLGRPTSWDPSGVGMVPMVLANSTPLTGNITAYLEAGNVLTYESGGKRYINVTGFDPGVNDRGTAYNLIARFVTAYQGFWGINNGTEFVENVMWQDLEIPLTSSENYTVGWVFQQRWESYAKLFAPALIVDGSDLIIDWNGTNAWTNMWMDAYWFEDLDLNVTSNRTYISDMMDWSFVDDQTGGYVFSATGSNAVLAADLDDDGTDDLGIGSLTWSVDGDGDLYCGITDDALMMNIMYPEDNGDTHGSDNHGVWTTAAAASRGVTGHDVYENGTLYNLPGIANGSKIIASTYFTSGDRLNSQFWAAGYHIQADGNFTYNAEGEMHRADLISNSWGVTLTSAADLSIYTIVWDIISTPGLMKPNYPGTLFLFSAGNDGQDYGTGGAPNNAFSAIAVGGTMINHLYEDSYGPNQEHGQTYMSSDTGPSMIGMVEPDVVAPAMFGYSPEPFQNTWVGRGDSYLWWSGTSLACPIAAGVAALIVEALYADGWTYNPMDIKNILLSSATDMGLDAMVQGHGIVNAEAAVTAIDSDSTTEYIFYDTSSFDNWAAEMTSFDSWWIDYGYYWMDVWTANMTTPAAFGESSNIYFGAVAPGAKSEVNFTIEDYEFARYDSSDMDTFQPWYYAMDAQYTFTATTDMYNDTSLPSGAGTVRNTPFNITAELGSETWMTAEYAFISVAVPAAASVSSIRLYDWGDTDADGTMTFYNATSKTGDYIQYRGRDSNGDTVYWIKIADPAGIDNLFANSPALIVFDSAATLTTGNAVDVTITTFEKIADADVLVNPYTSGATATNITLVVPSDADYGIHQGFISVVDGGFMHEVPYSYMVEFTLDTTDSTPKTVIDTFGDELTPYESGALFGGLGQSAQGARNFKVVVPDGHPTYNRSILVMRAEWQNAGTVVDIRLFTENYDYAWGGAASTSGAPTESTTNTLVFEPGGLANGTYYLVIDGSISGADVPENVTVTMQWYDTADLPDASMAFTYTSSDRAGVTQIVNEDTVWGDHAVVNTSFAPFNVVNLPEYEVTNVEVGFLSGVYAVQGGTLVIPSASYDPFSSPILADEFAWERVEGIVEGDNVNVEVDFSNGDCDIMAWWADSDNATWNYGNNLLGAQMATGAHPEIGSFVADQSGAIMVGIFDYDLQAGTYEVIVDTLVGIYEDADSNEMIYDTYDIGRNGTFVVEIAASTDTNVGFDYTYTELTFENFFSPSLNSIDTDGDPVVNITWTVSDLNAADNQTFTVHISNDAGLSWQLVAAGLEDTEYIWDSTGFVDQSYMAQVRVTDSYGLTDTIDSAAFDAGTVTITPTTTTTPPETTTTTEPPAPPQDFVLIGLIAGIGAGVVIVLILFLVKRR